MSKERRPLWSESTWKVPPGTRAHQPSFQLVKGEKMKEVPASQLHTHKKTGLSKGRKRRDDISTHGLTAESELETGQDSEPAKPAPGDVHPPARPINLLKPHQLGIQYSISRVDGGHQHPHPLSYGTATSYFSGCFFVWHRVPSSTGELWTRRLARGDLELLI